MPHRKRPAIPAASRKSLLEWIENDGNSTDISQLACSSQAQALHARFLADPYDGNRETPEPLASPSALRLPPLG
ncbi:hypothetical protein [Sphingobium sp. CFD-2]|jgi:hypothetical protein|uniref:hypothetical protein n=1 Tax=Sphingobium sp. CFD-2 TaxID=2878542 RepID=UPI00214BB2EE|nr:hypothetical protein [Sphingobium sp. CFD-2]